MKKIIPIIAIIGAGSLVALGANKIETKKESFINNFNSFQEDLHDYTNLNEKNLAKTVFNKYNLTIENGDLQDLETINNLEALNKNDGLQEKTTENVQNIPQKTNENPQTYNEKIIDNSTSTTSEEDLENTEENNQIEKISTLYSLSSDIEDSCDDFCELKEEITGAIIETQNLIEKVRSKELELTKEQRMFITEQSIQLKNLGRQLSNITTELSFQLSDLNQVMTTNGDNIDSLNMKYLIVLDNLVNGNEMLQSGLSSLNLINQMFNANSTLPPNNQGRILYGFQHNNNPPIIKDYFINENGEIVDNSQSENKTQENQDNVEENAMEVENENKANIDTYQNKALKTNIDTYYNTNMPRNIDSFFNTALLDNEFMYGNGAYGYGANAMYGQANPYMYNYTNYEKNNTINSNNNMNSTQNTENDEQVEKTSNKTKKEKKRIKLKKNIDTFKDENEPDIKTKLGNIKNSITGFFTKLKKPDLKLDLDDKIDNPIYRYDVKK